MSLTDYSLQVGDKFTLTSPGPVQKTASAVNGQITAAPGPIIGAIPPVDDTSGYWFERLDPNDPTKYQNGTGVMTTTGGNYPPSQAVGPTSNAVMIPSVWIQDQELEERVRCVLEGKMRRDEEWEVLMEEFTIPREEAYTLPSVPGMSDRLRAMFPFLRIVDEIRGLIYFAWHNGVLLICQPPVKGVWTVKSRSYPQIPNAQPYPNYQPQPMGLPSYPGNAPYPTAAPSPYVAPYTWADAAGEQYTLTNASGEELKQWNEVFKSSMSEEYLKALLNTKGSSP